MIWESFEVDAPEIAITDCKAFRRTGRDSEELEQFAVEFVRKLSSPHIFIVIHDPKDVSCDLRMKLKTH